jgi:hypothetical protein
LSRPMSTAKGLCGNWPSPFGSVGAVYAGGSNTGATQAVSRQAPWRGRSGPNGCQWDRGGAGPGARGARRHPECTLPAVRGALSAARPYCHEESRRGAAAAAAHKKHCTPRHKRARRCRDSGPPSARRGQRLLPRRWSWSTHPAATTPWPGRMAGPLGGRVLLARSPCHAGHLSRWSGRWAW